jgi:hypothetical protein
MKGDKDGPALVIGFGTKKDKGKSAETDDEDMAEAPEEETPAEDTGEGDELTMHAEALADAVLSGDRAGIVEAVKKCFLAHEGGGYEDAGAEDTTDDSE